MHGGLIKFVPHGTQPVWEPLFAEMLSRAEAWDLECPVYHEGPSHSVLVVSFDHTTLLRRIPFNLPPLRAAVARLLGIAQARLILDRPQRGALQDVLHFGDPCSDVVAAREAPTVRDADSRGFCIFLDPRQVGYQVTKLHLSQAEVDADYLARFAGILRVPAGFYTSFCADRATSRHLVVQDGDVITFGFCPIEPASEHRDVDISPEPQSMHRGSSSHNGTAPPIDDYRLLREPASDSHLDRARVEQVRDDVEAAGGVWPYLPADDPYAQERLALAHDIHLDAEATCSLVFVILIPAVVNETVTVQLTLPATVDDAIDAVANARDRSLQQLFPHLGDVQPQPLLDFGTLYALPEWCPDENAVCFNLVGWDGRFYVTIQPPRSTKEAIVQHAGILMPDAVNVFVNTSSDPLADDVWVDLPPGSCVSFYSRHVLPGPYFLLHDMLLSADTWPADPVIPDALMSDSGHRLCAVCETGSRVVRRVVPDSDPELAIASALGVGAEDILVQESAPAVHNAALNGWPCQRVFAFAEPADPITGIRTTRIVLSFVDCRALLEGWLLVATASGAVRVREICSKLTTFCPPGYRVYLVGIDMQAEFYFPNPGQVVTAAFVLCSPPESEQAADDGDEGDNDLDFESSSSEFSDPPYAADGGSDDGTEADTAHSRSRSPRGHRSPDVVDSLCYASIGDKVLSVTRVVDALWDQCSCASLGSGFGLFPSVIWCDLLCAGKEPPQTSHRPATSARLPDSGLPVADTPGAHHRHLQQQLDRQTGDPPFQTTPELQADTGDGGPFVDAAFPQIGVPVPLLLFTPDYRPEEVTVDLVLPTTTLLAIESVQASRARHGRQRFPALHVVEPQPLPTTAVLLALPDWCRSVHVLVDCSRFLGQIFCLFVSPRMTLESILTAVGIEHHAPVAVYVHNEPAPMLPGQAFEMRTGYCISIVGLPSPPFEVASLATMLLAAAGWGPAHTVTGISGQWICLLTDTEPVLFPLRQDRRQHLRVDIAARLERDVAGLTVVPSVPRITDYYDRGYFTSGVGVATYDARASSDSQALYFLDLRPILCDFAWGFAHHGAILAETLVARFDQFAPEGFRSMISGARIEHTDNGLLLHVRHGGILVVDYVPREVASSSTEDDPP